MIVSGAENISPGVEGTGSQNVALLKAVWGGSRLSDWEIM